jgi:hypothetical protein
VSDRIEPLGPALPPREAGPVPRVERVRRRPREQQREEPQRREGEPEDEDGVRHVDELA